MLRLCDINRPGVVGVALKPIDHVDAVISDGVIDPGVLDERFHVDRRHLSGKCLTHCTEAGHLTRVRDARSASCAAPG